MITRKDISNSIGCFKFVVVGDDWRFIEMNGDDTQHADLVLPFELNEVRGAGIILINHGKYEIICDFSISLKKLGVINCYITDELINELNDIMGETHEDV